MCVISFLSVSLPSQLIDRDFVNFPVTLGASLPGSFHLDAIMVGDGLTDPGTQVPTVCPTPNPNSWKPARRLGPNRKLYLPKPMLKGL